ATQLAREALGSDIGHDTPGPFTVGEITALGSGFFETFEGVVQHGAGALAVDGQHWLGFAGDPREAIVCTVVCTEPMPEPGVAGRCFPLVDASRPRGTWWAPPPPSLLVRTLLLAAERPYQAAALLSAALLAAAVLVIALRPRPRARPS